MKQITLRTTEQYSFILIATNKEGIKHTEMLLERYKELGLRDLEGKEEFLNALYAYGNIDDVIEQQAKPFIPVYKIHKDNDKGKETIKEYKCYCGESNPINNVILHECPLSSLRCACSALDTKYFYIIKEITNGENSDRNPQLYKKSEDVGTSESETL